VRSLYTRLAVILTLLFGLVALLFVLLLSQASERYQQEVAQKLNATLAKNMVAERLLFREGEIDHAALEQLFHVLMVINPRVELYLLDSGGRILAFSAPPGKVHREVVDLAPVRRFLSGDYTPPLGGDDPRSLEQQKVFSVAPIDVGGRRVGYLYVILASEQYDSVAQMLAGSYVIKRNILLSLVVVVFALLVGLLLFGVLTRRLRRLTHAGTAAMRSIASPAASTPWHNVYRARCSACRIPTVSAANWWPMFRTTCAHRWPRCRATWKPCVSRART
jgi:hypothetical protein